MTQNGRLYLPQSGFPLQQIIMQQKVDQLCKWAFLPLRRRKRSNHSLQIEATRRLLRRFPTDLCFLPVDPTCRRHADPTVKRCFFFFLSGEQKHCRRAMTANRRFQAELFLTEEIFVFSSVIYGGWSTLRRSNFNRSVIRHDL